MSVPEELSIGNRCGGNWAIGPKHFGLTCELKRVCFILAWPNLGLIIYKKRLQAHAQSLRPKEAMSNMAL